MSINALRSRYENVNSYLQVVYFNISTVLVQSSRKVNMNLTSNCIFNLTYSSTVHPNLKHKQAHSFVIHIIVEASLSRKKMPKKLVYRIHNCSYIAAIDTLTVFELENL